METKDYLLNELQKVDKWEQEQKDLWFWEKLGRLPFVLLDKITPKFLQEKALQVVDEIGSYVQTGGRYLINKQTVMEKYKDQIEGLNTLDEDQLLTQVSQLPITSMDTVAQRFKNSRSKMATIQGASTGIGGIFTLAIDVPLILGLSLKTIQEIALAYGYDPDEKSERIFIVKCLQFTSSDIIGKKAILEELTQMNREMGPQAHSQLRGWREVLTTYRDNFGWKKLFQLVPVAGIIFGAYINKSAIQEVAETSMMLYRKRRLQEKLSELEATTTNL